jgi:hypothetical protein
MGCGATKSAVVVAQLTRSNLAFDDSEQDQLSPHSRPPPEQRGTYVGLLHGTKEVCFFLFISIGKRQKEGEAPHLHRL